MSWEAFAERSVFGAALWGVTQSGYSFFLRREPLVESSERQQRAFGFHVVAWRPREKIFRFFFFSEIGANSNTVVFEGTGKPESVRGGYVKLL